MTAATYHRDTRDHNRAAVLRFLVGYIDRNGYPPSVREIMRGVDGLNTTSAVKYHLDALAEAGAILRTPGIARAIVVLDDETV